MILSFNVTVQLTLLNDKLGQKLVGYFVALFCSNFS